ncbi:MAG: nucleoside deaminase [Isosphaeraceae bacterium]
MNEPKPNSHERFMRRAIELGRRNPRLPFGALIVERDSGKVLAEGWNRTELNPTWHGEIDAINHLASAHPRFDGKGLILYSTAESCPMCQSAILWSGIGAVVFGSSIRFLQELGWRQIDVLAEEIIRRTPWGRCEVTTGVLRAECDALFEAALREKGDGVSS